jgi:hypothetical protein
MIANAQQNNNAATLKLVMQKDSLFWHCYNNCTMQAIAPLINDSIEFYHDNGGITLGAASLINSIDKYICNNPDGSVTRKANAKKSNVHLLKNNNIVYGALFTGYHFFYITPNGKKITKTGIAQYANLWLLKNNMWQLARVFSYDHKPL